MISTTFSLIFCCPGPSFFESSSANSASPCSAYADAAVRFLTPTSLKRTNDAGAHPNGVVGGDTLYAASKVLAIESGGDGARVTFRLVGVKNRTSASAFAEHGDALFTEELSKKDGKIKDKVVEITRTLLVRRR